MASKREQQRLRIVHSDCAGIDIGKRSHYVAVDPDRSTECTRRFGSFTDELEAMGQWLKDCGIRIVAMESTGVYWIPVYEVLDRLGLEVHLVNPRATRQVSGRKSDVLDCQWLWQLMSHGLLRGAFRPPDAVCELRAYVRQRARLVRDAARSVQHMQKALTQMNVQLDSVLSDLMGKTGQLIVRAIVAGEREGEVLARHRDGRVKADEATLARSLRGTWRTEHLFELQQALERYDFLKAQTCACDERIQQLLCEPAPEPAPGPAPDAEMSVTADTSAARPRGRKRAAGPPLPSKAREQALGQALMRTLGVDLTTIPTIGIETALVIASEIGPDLSRFPSSQHFCSWLHLAPGTRISGDRPLRGPGGPGKRHNIAGQALRQAASTARRSDSFIGASHRSRLARMEKGKAVKATAHQLARLIYSMLTRGQAYVERGIEAFEAERRARTIRQLKRRAMNLGYTLTDNQEFQAA